MKAVDEEYQNHTCFPPKELIFAAFDYCSFDDLKVVIIGQDPYHGLGELNGLCFSVNDGIKIPPSLRNIFREMNDDLGTVFLSQFGQFGILGQARHPAFEYFPFRLERILPTATNT